MVRPLHVRLDETKDTMGTTHAPRDNGKHLVRAGNGQHHAAQSQADH